MSIKQLLKKISTAVFVIVAIIGIVFEFLNYENYPMPEEAGYPYIQLAEFGVEGKRIENPLNNEKSKVIENHTLLKKHWHTREFIEKDGGSDSWRWLYQDVYILRVDLFRDAFVKKLMRDSIFARSEEAFFAVEIEGLDKAYVTDSLDCIAVKDNMICCLTYNFATRENMQEALTAISEKWNEVS